MSVTIKCRESSTDLGADGSRFGAFENEGTGFLGIFNFFWDLTCEEGVRRGDGAVEDVFTDGEDKERRSWRRKQKKAPTCACACQTFLTLPLRD